jgi:hypothetical protein
VSQRKRKIKTKNRVNNITKNNSNQDVNKEKLINQLDSLTSEAKKRKESVKVEASTKRNYYIFGGVVIAVIVIGFIAFSPLGGPDGIPGLGNAPPVTTYTNACIGGHSNLEVHYHVNLFIYNDGLLHNLPDEVGITQDCLSPIHVHSGDPNRLHIEVPTGFNLPPATLGNFFDIWDQPLTETQVWNHSGTINMTVNGNPFAPPFGQVILSTEQNIIINITS